MGGREGEREGEREFLGDLFNGWRMLKDIPSKSHTVSPSLPAIPAIPAIPLSFSSLNTWCFPLKSSLSSVRQTSSYQDFIVSTPS